MACRHPPLQAQAVVSAVPALSGQGRLFVAYSGGLDSTVLLHLLSHHYPRPDRVRAVHVDHGLQPQSAEWAAWCRRQCAAWSVPFKSLAVCVDRGGGVGVEAAARQARYRALFGAMGGDDILATGQHADDQAETLLLQLLRGAGPRGLAAMPSQRAAEGGRTLVRPLLGCTRTTLHAYALRHGLQWLEDPSNARQDLQRNYVRHALMPVLRARWPQLTVTLGRSAALCAEAAALMDELAAQDLAGVRAEPRCGALSAAALSDLASRRARNVLRHWLCGLGLSTPTRAHLRQVERDVLQSAPESSPRVGWPGAEVRRYRDQVWAMPTLASPPAPDLALPWRPGEQPQLCLPSGCGRLLAESTRGAGLRLDERPLDITFRSGGERLRPEPGGRTRTLKHLCQEAGIPPWVRARLPLVYVEDKLVAVADRWIDADWRAGAGECGVSLHWLPPPMGYQWSHRHVAAG